MSSFLWVSGIMFFLGLAYFAVAIFLLSRRHPLKSSVVANPRVAVLVAVRNEEHYLEGCLQALAVQTYPENLYDVYIIDDRSTDGSAAIARSFEEQYKHFHVLTVKRDAQNLHGKMNALNMGMQASKAEIILITDADCIVPVSWIENHVAYFADPVGMVGGLTMLYPFNELKPARFKDTIWSKVQALDWLFLQSIAAFSSHYGKPITILGNNFGFRRKAYEQVGGFPALGFSLTEDFLLMKAIEEQTDWKIIQTLDTGNAIFSYPLADVKTFFSQRLRWIRGGRKARPWGYFIIGLSVLSHFFILMTIIFRQWTTPAAMGIGLVLGMNYLIIKQGLLRTGIPFLKKYYLHFALFHLIYLLIFSFLSILPLRVKWKERSF